MAIRFVIVTLTIMMIGLSTASVARAAENDRDTAIAYEPELKRPAILPALYATLAVVQGWDLYSTRAALKAGAREANPAAAVFAGHAGALLGLKAVTTASTIFFAERMWKKNKVGAIVMLAAINGATAAVSLHNVRNAKLAAARQ